MRTVKNGHWILFIVGFIFPLLWIIGGVIPPKGMSRVDAAYAAKNRTS